MKDALYQFHVALEARLSSFPALVAYKGINMAAPGVKTFDHVPSGTVQPYNVLESMDSVRRGLFGGAGADLSAQVGTWDNYAGTIRLREIGALIVEAMDEPLAVTGWGTVQAEVDQQFTVRDTSGLRRLVSRINAEMYR